MRLFLSLTSATMVGLALLNAAVLPAPSEAQTLTSPATVQIGGTTGQAPVAVDQTMAPKDTAPAADESPVATAPATLAELVAAHRDAVADDEETNCIATAVYFEAKGEPLSGQLAVAQVMLNRAHSGRFPQTACGVVRQKGQFSFVRNGKLPQVKMNSQAWQTARAMAYIAQAGLWQPMVGRAMFFHAKHVSPHWHATEIAALGHHIFYE